MSHDPVTGPQLRGESAVTTIRVSDLDRFRALVFQGRALASRMRVAADPFAGDVERLIDRFVAPIEPDQADRR